MKGWGNLSSWSVKRLKGLRDAFYWCEKVEKKFWFCDLFILKRQCIYSSLKRDAKYVKHVPLKVYESGTFSRNLPTKKTHCQVIDGIHHLKTGNL